MDDIIRSGALLFVLLNPFTMSIYLSALIEDLDWRLFSKVLARGTIISAIVFIAFAALGDAVFTDILQARFASFLIFGGVVFLVMGVKMVFTGSETFKALRGDPEHLGGAIAMPFMIGPGTVSASILAGGRLSPWLAGLTIALTMLLVFLGLLLVKRLFDHFRKNYESFVRRYMEITGRITALMLGTISVEMILQGIEAFLKL